MNRTPILAMAILMPLSVTWKRSIEIIESWKEMALTTLHPLCHVVIADLEKTHKTR